jgi:phage-related protein
LPPRKAHRRATACYPEAIFNSLLEVIARHDGDTFRAVYTVRFAEAVYVLHVFQKKSKRGIATPKKDLDLVRNRLKLAEQEHKQWSAAGGRA